MWNKEKQNEYNKKYQAENKEKIREQRKEYRAAHKEEIADKKKKYYSQEDKRKRKSERSALSYQNNRDKVLQRQESRRKERLDFMNKIALQYGCQNIDCKWQGELIGCQYDFHHYDPSQKITSVAKMLSYSYSKIINEINKCIVLCKNCHALVHAGIVVVDESKKCNMD